MLWNAQNLMRLLMPTMFMQISLKFQKKNQLIMLTAAAIRSLTKGALLIYETGPVMTSLAIFNQLDCGTNTYTKPFTTN